MKSPRSLAAKELIKLLKVLDMRLRLKKAAILK
ncbi:MAG: hypothetical protein JWR09_2684 [Mucilaginibacter sp.]|nr:hypothetical protein [Mucilaginibacter sp.]